MILAPGTIVTTAIKELTSTIPVVSTTGDPVGSGCAASLARPEGNITGLPSLEPSISGKWLELLKQVAPRLARVGIVLNPVSQPAWLLSYIDAAAAAVGVEAIKIPVRDYVDVVRMIDAFATKPNGGLVIVPPPPSLAIWDTILDAASGTGCRRSARTAT